MQRLPITCSINDKTVLKYISATQGNYLPNDDVFIRPMIREDDTYTLTLDAGDATQIGTTVTSEGSSFQYRISFSKSLKYHPN